MRNRKQLPETGLVREPSLGLKGTNTETMHHGGRQSTVNTLALFCYLTGMGADTTGNVAISHVRGDVWRYVHFLIHGLRNQLRVN